MAKDGLDLSPIHEGRSDLADWLDAQPDNFYLADDGLERALQLLLSEADALPIIERLKSFGAEAARISPLVSENNLQEVTLL